AQDFQLAVAIFVLVAREKLIVRVKITDDVLRLVGTQHLRHAAARPRLIDFAVTALARIGTRISRKRTDWRTSLQGRLPDRVLLFSDLPQEGLKARPGILVKQLMDSLQLGECFGCERTVPFVNS